MSGKKVVDWRRRTKQNALTYKGGCCIVCGYNRTPRSIHFHHLDPTQKDLRVGSGIPKAWVTIRVELNKCVALCSNCHGEVHDGILDLNPHLHKNPTPQEGQQRLMEAGVAGRLSKSARRGEPRPWNSPKSCKRCSASIGPKSTYCRCCLKKALPPPPKILWPPVADLLAEVEATSKLAVGKRLGVSDRAVAKHLKKHVLGYQFRGYARSTL